MNMKINHRKKAGVKASSIVTLQSFFLHVVLFMAVRNIHYQYSTGNGGNGGNGNCNGNGSNGGVTDAFTLTAMVSSARRRRMARTTTMAAMVQNPRDVESSSNILTNGNHGTKEATEASSSSSYSSSATTSTIKTRRGALTLATKATTATALALATTTTTFLLPQNANAETTASTSQIQLLDQQSSRFKRIPLFAIVSSTTGTPFMILQNTGRAQAYFFTTYDGAQLVLSDAIRDAADKDLSTVNMWNEAKISAVNLELVLKLNKNKGRYKALAQNNVKYEAVYDVIPSIKALNDAERIDKSGMYSERGRVPLFYANDFQLESTSSNAGSASGSPGSSGSGSGDGDGGKLGRIPVFFEKADLLREYTKKYPDKTDVVITVVDLMDLFEVMMGNKPIGAKVDDTIIDRMVFVPTGESRKRAIECEKGRGVVSAYKVGEMIAVGGK